MLPRRLTGQWQQADDVTHDGARAVTWPAVARDVTVWRALTDSRAWRETRFVFIFRLLAAWSQLLPVFDITRDQSHGHDNDVGNSAPRWGGQDGHFTSPNVIRFVCTFSQNSWRVNELQVKPVNRSLCLNSCLLNQHSESNGQTTAEVLGPQMTVTLCRVYILRLNYSRRHLSLRQTLKTLNFCVISHTMTGVDRTDWSNFNGDRRYVLTIPLCALESLSFLQPLLSQ